MTWTNMPIGEPANDEGPCREGTGVWVEDGGCCIEPGGFELERTVERIPCPNPRCGARAELIREERAEGSLNIYEWVECRACGCQKGDVPDDRWWAPVPDEEEERRRRIEAQDRENERRWRVERRLEEVLRCYGPMGHQGRLVGKIEMP